MPARPISPRTAAVIAGAAVLVFVLYTLFMAGMLPFGGGSDPFAPCRATRIAGGPGAFTVDFTLTDETGRRVTDEQVFAKPSLVYLGYTFCPDVCPTDNARNAEAVDLLEKRGYEVQPVFITIDPERDTPEAVAEFTDAFHPRMLGLTGSPEEIAAVAKGFRAYFAKAGEGEDYLMDHSTFTYLVLPGRGVVDLFRRDMTPEQVADAVACYLEHL